MMSLSAHVDFDSTTLASAIYDHRQNQLQVDFRDGSRYSYSAVAPAVFRDLVASPSKGKFFNRYIRGRFPFCQTGRRKLSGIGLKPTPQCTRELPARVSKR